jgi:ABC-type bacteriocin/lantibiotic exporter with double-glycine peptidase domain
MPRKIFIFFIFAFLSNLFAELESPPPSYREILSLHITPKIKPGYSFPVSVQYYNGCLAFAINHILEYKYGKKIDLRQAEKKIKKPRKDLWTETHIRNFLKEYKITLSWYERADIFFTLLKQGEPVMIQYKYYLSKKSWVGHFVAVYSFDDTGVFVSDSVSGKRIHLSYNQVFNDSGRYTQFGFARVEKEK